MFLDMDANEWSNVETGISDGVAARRRVIEMKLAVTFLIPLAFGLASGSPQATERSSTVPTLLATAVAAEPAPTMKVGLQNVIIVYKTHFDIGYTTMAGEVVHGYRTEMADRVLDAIENNRNQPKEQQFVWTVSGWPMKQILWEGQSPRAGGRSSRRSATATSPSTPTRSRRTRRRRNRRTWCEG